MGPTTVGTMVPVVVTMCASVEILSMGQVVLTKDVSCVLQVVMYDLFVHGFLNQSVYIYYTLHVLEKNYVQSNNYPSQLVYVLFDLCALLGVPECQNNGTCSDDGYCYCPFGYSGQRCENRQLTYLAYVYVVHFHVRVFVCVCTYLISCTCV